VLFVALLALAGSARACAPRLRRRPLVQRGGRHGSRGRRALVARGVAAREAATPAEMESRPRHG